MDASCDDVKATRGKKKLAKEIGGNKPSGCRFVQDL